MANTSRTQNNRSDHDERRLCRHARAYAPAQHAPVRFDAGRDGARGQGDAAGVRSLPRALSANRRIPHALGLSFACWQAAINEGLAKLKNDAWICHIDSDIVLAPNARESFEIAQLPTDSIYGIDRLECKSYEDWLRFPSTRPNQSSPATTS